MSAAMSHPIEEHDCRREPHLSEATAALRFAHEALSASSSAAVTARRLAEHVSDSLGTPTSVYLVTADRELILVHSTAGVEEQNGLALARDALAGAPLALSPGLDGLFPRRALDRACSVALPLATDSSQLGALVVEGVGELQELELIAALGNVAACALAQRERLHTTVAEARRDALTGLRNARAFHERLQGLVERPSGAELSLITFDIDDFKLINDREGHLVGDRVLRQVAEASSAGLRSGEEPFRLGGEEFAVIVPGCGAIAEQVAERIRERLATWPAGGRLPSISAGIASFPQDGTSGEELLHKADVALYAAKERGKDQVVTYTRSLTDDTALVVERMHEQREGEWWSRVLGLAVGPSDGDRKAPGWRPQDVARLAESVGARLGLTATALRVLTLGAILAELAKLGIPDAITTKRGQLGDREWRLVRERLGQLSIALESIPFLANAVPIVRHCRERWDGKGYPDRLAGTEIPIGARIVAVTDAFCAMTSARSYRSARSRARALLELQELAGSRFDPACVRALREVVESPAGKRADRGGKASTSG